MQEMPTVEVSGKLAVEMSEHLNANDQAFFVAGFQECMKYICAQRKNEKTKLQETLSILEAYESLEAELIMCDEVWDTTSGLPQLPERFYERFIELQGRRNNVLGRFE